MDLIGIQAAIAAVHAEAPRASDTDWPQIVGLYNELLKVVGDPEVAKYEKKKK